MNKFKKLTFITISALALVFGMAGGSAMASRGDDGRDNDFRRFDRRDGDFRRFDRRNGDFRRFDFDDRNRKFFHNSFISRRFDDDKFHRGFERFDHRGFDDKFFKD